MAKILVAEDDDSMRTFIRQALIRAGHEVDSVPDGSAALDAVMRKGYDLLLADVVMPGVDGIELVRRTADRCPQMQVMFITGFAAVAMNHGSTGNRVARVLSKPFHLRDLVQQIDRMLALRPAMA